MINQRSSPATKSPLSTKRIVIKDLTQDAHYKISVAAAYNGLTIKDFVLKAIKKYVADQVGASLPEAILTHPSLAPSSLNDWLAEDPSFVSVVIEDNDSPEEIDHAGR